jgi:hypothetical protein
MNDQASISTSDDRIPNSVTYEEFSKQLEPLLDITTQTSSTTDTGSLIQTHTILPFTIKPNSSAIYSNEKEPEEKFL